MNNVKRWLTTRELRAAVAFAEKHNLDKVVFHIIDCGLGDLVGVAEKWSDEPESCSTEEDTDMW